MGPEWAAPAARKIQSLPTGWRPKTSSLQRFVGRTWLVAVSLKWAIGHFDQSNSLLIVFGWFFTDFALWLSIPANLCSVRSCTELTCDWILRWFSTDVSFELFLHKFNRLHAVVRRHHGSFFVNLLRRLKRFVLVFSEGNFLYLGDTKTQTTNVQKIPTVYSVRKQISLFLDFAKLIYSNLFIELTRVTIIQQYKFSHLLFVCYQSRIT